MAVTGGTRRIVGGVDTHKDLHVAAVVDEQDRVIGTRSFATTRQGYRQCWPGCDPSESCKASESSRPAATAPAYSASRSNLALSFLRSRPRTSRIGADAARMTISMLRTGPCRLCRPTDRDAAKPRRHDRTPTDSHGLPEDRGERQARRPADDPQHDICAPDGLRDQLRSLTRMQLVRTLAAWRPDLTAYRDVDSAYRIGLKS
jgi:transposase